MEWSLRSQPTGQSLTDLHTTEFAKVGDLYHQQDPQSLETYKARQEEIVTKFSAAGREQLVMAIRPFLASVNAPASALNELDKLQNPDATVVVAGQQAGLFTGPLYSVYKALSAVGLAKRLEQQLGKPVVPIFWIASEDHDWGEVDHAYLLDAADDVRRIRLKDSAPLHQMVHHYPLSSESVDRALAELNEILPQGPWRNEVLEAVHESAQRGSTMVEWFASLMYRLLGETGLVMIDPCLPELRQLVGGVWSKVIESRETLAQNLNAKYRDVQERDFEPAVIRDEANTTLFYVQDGKRYVMEQTADKDKLRARGLGLEDSVAGWLEKVKQSPDSFSSNVLLRPVVQDFLLPTLAFVGGPAEIAYHALAGGVFETLERRMPPLFLRDRLTVYPPSVQRNMEKWDVSQAELSQPQALQDRAVDILGGSDLDATGKEMESVSAARWNAFAEQYKHLGPQIETMARAQVKREVQAVQRTIGKAKNLLANAHESEVRQLRHIERWLWMDGHLQERRLCPLNFWSRYGLDWLHDLPFWGDYATERGVFNVEL